MFLKNWSFKKHLLAVVILMVPIALLLLMDFWVPYAFLALGIADSLTNTDNNGAVIGIIGSADGPTTIYVSSKISQLSMSIGVISLFLILLTAYYPIKKIFIKDRI